MMPDTPDPRCAAPPSLEVIRHSEAEVRRRLAAEREAVQAVIAQAEQRARALLAAAEVDGRREGEAQRELAQAAADRTAQEIVARARAGAEALQRAGEARLEAAVVRATQILIGGTRET
jgi:vacuolar-type H+-ATPase subunit H